MTGAMDYGLRMATYGSNIIVCFSKIESDLK